MKPPTPHQNQQAIERWNKKYPVGTPVTVRLDDGSVNETKTRSAAYVLSGHTAVIFVDGISGCYLLSRVAAVEVEAPAK
jgi:hypothetical protein